MANEITVATRSALGKANRGLRRTGQVPGVVYGKGSESLPVQVEEKALEALYRAAGRSSLVELQVGGGRARSAIIKGLQRHPLSGHPLHVDFFLVDLKQEMEVDIPLVFSGQPPAVELTGGTLMTPISYVRVRALPTDLPHEIGVDVSGLLDLDSALHVRDLVVDEKVHVLTDGDELLARVLPPRIEEEPVVAEVEEAEGEAAEGEAAEAAEGGEGGEAPTGEAAEAG